MCQVLQDVLFKNKYSSKPVREFAWAQYRIGDELPGGAFQGGVSEQHEPLYVTRGQVTTKKVAFGWFNPLDKIAAYASFSYRGVVKKTEFDILIRLGYTAVEPFASA